MNVTTLVVIGTLVAGASPAPRQDPVPVPPPADTQPQAPAMRTALDTRRQDIRVMETALLNALQTGARELARLLKLSEPNSAFVTGAGRARGFVLEGYGLFFDVDVPEMRQSVVWSTQMGQLAQDREEAIRLVSSMRPDDPRRPLAIARVRQIEALMRAAQDGQVLLPPALPLPAETAPTQFVARERVTATSVADNVSVTTASPAVEAPSVAAPAAAAPSAGPLPPSSAAAAHQMPQIRDPNELYTEAVKNALIDAMLRYSQFLRVTENEWLTVAASDSDGPPAPGQLDDRSRILISIRGVDLAAFQSGKLTREEVLKRVQVREF